LQVAELFLVAVVGFELDEVLALILGESVEAVGEFDAALAVDGGFEVEDAVETPVRRRGTIARGGVLPG
jgi:hypothetical protein